MVLTTSEQSIDITFSNLNFFEIKKFILNFKFPCLKKIEKLSLNFLFENDISAFKNEIEQFFLESHFNKKQKVWLNFDFVINEKKICLKYKKENFRLNLDLTEIENINDVIFPEVLKEIQQYIIEKSKFYDDDNVEIEICNEKFVIDKQCKTDINFISDIPFYLKRKIFQHFISNKINSKIIKEIYLIFPEEQKIIKCSGIYFKNNYVIPFWAEQLDYNTLTKNISNFDERSFINWWPRINKPFWAESEIEAKQILQELKPVFGSKKSTKKYLKENYFDLINLEQFCYYLY